MNQILYIDEKNSTSSINLKNIVIFFAISIIILGLIMVVEGSYGVYAYSKSEDKNKTINQTTEEADIQISKNDESNTINISINSKIGISELIYNWNSEVPVTLQQNGKKSVYEYIDIPAGENTINIRVIDIEGNETKKNETFTRKEEKPVIELSIVGDKIKINVNSKVELSNVTYKWNSENPNTIDMVTYEDKTKFEKQIDIPKGQNTLKITAIDINGNTSEKSQEVKGITKPKIKIYVKGEFLHFSVTAEETIKVVDFIFNGNYYRIDSQTIGEKNEVNYKMKLIEGMNYIKIIADTKSGAKEEYIGKYDYKKQ